MSMLLLTMGPNLSIMADIPAVGVGNPGVIRFRPIGAIGPVKWTLVDSTLPAEWDSALNPDGNAVTLTTADAETAGTFSVTVRAVDNARIPVVRSFDVRVMALPLTISGSLPQWTVGKPVTGTLAITGGSGTYVGLAILAGSLPSGVSASLSGASIVFSGSPSTHGDGGATLEVTDSHGAAGSISVAWDVMQGFDPAVLFAGGVRGAWHDPSDLATLFQDSAGTTPVTATGQRVGRMLDKSGNGNHVFTTSSPERRPILRQDGGGNYYLEFIAANTQFLQDGIRTQMAFGTDSLTVIYAASVATSGNNGIISRARTAGTLGRWYVYATGSSLYCAADLLGSSPFPTNTSAMDANKHIVSMAFDRPGVLEVDVRVDSEVSGVKTNPSNEPVLGYYDGSNPFCIGAYPDASGGFDPPETYSTMSFYGSIVRYETTDEGLLIKAEQWLADKAGVSL